MPVKIEEEAYENIIEMSNNNDYTTGNFLDFDYFQQNCKLIVIDLQKKTKSKDLQQINCIGELERDHLATMFFVTKKSEETTFNFSQNFVTIF